MNGNYKIIIMTDNNRRLLEIMLTDDLLSTVQHLYQSNRSLSNSFVSLNRIVYVESFASKSEAEKRLSVIRSYPRIFCERLIRKSNPNWLNLYPIRPIPRLYGAEMYA